MPLSPEKSKTRQRIAGVYVPAQKNSPSADRSRQPASRPRSKHFRLHWKSILEHGGRLLTKGMLHHQRQLNSAVLQQLTTAFEGWVDDRKEEFDGQLENVPKAARGNWVAERLEGDNRSFESQAARQLCEFLPAFVSNLLKQIEQLQANHQQFRRMVARVDSKREFAHVILDYAAQLGASKAELKQDEKSLSRWLDEGAMQDRFLKAVGEKKLLLGFTLDRLGQIVTEVFRLANQFAVESWDDPQTPEPSLDPQSATHLWQRLNLENCLMGVVEQHQGGRLAVAALKCLRVSLAQLPAATAIAIFDPEFRVLINRLAMNYRTDVWLQCEALEICATLQPAIAIPFLQQRAKQDHGSDDIFVRRHVWRLLTRQLKQQPNLKMDFCTGGEASPFVRQQIAEAALMSSSDEGHESFMRLGSLDPQKEVRAATLANSLHIELSPRQSCRVLELIGRVLGRESDPFVLRTAFHVAVTLFENLTKELSEPSLGSVVDIYRELIEPAIRRLERESESIPVRRWAAQSGEKLWAIASPEATQLVDSVRESLAKTKRGGVARFSKKLFAGHSDEIVGRALAVLAIDDFGYEVHRGLFNTRIRRGDHFGFRFWRFWHELTHPATDKRQALRHTTGRISTSTVRISSQIGSELSETKVPGEALLIAADGTWRPFLPLLDDFVSLLNMGWVRQQEVTFYSSQGITRVKSPRSLPGRFRACFCLSFRFASIARLRNWNRGSWPRHRYINKLREVGFEVSFVRHSNDQFESAGPDDSVESFFENERNTAPFAGSSAETNPGMMAASLIAFDRGEILHSVSRSVVDFVHYFYSPFENSLPQLVAFAFVVLLLFLAKHLLENIRFRRARQKIPLSIGGWGTRGKSGTERLKAALLGVMGHGLVSKTTGCEAMFIHGFAHGQPLEIPLFRPLDKATIWEQKDLFVHASKMNPSVFLWECMALTPAYVDVLQRQWTQDDLATVTNTYPDHEDVQGPAGHDVARSIAGFVPLDSHLITTEEEMLPYISDSCRDAESSLQRIGWLESGLITDDILSRFPYEEHPNNIALVAAMGSRLGCDYDYSLKAMADYLVPDLGVLKTHPVATVRHRDIEFTNGCSANERFGCMGNWQRLGFDSFDPWADPATWICGVVNNRADRVPRSKVFAKIIVDDIQADRFFLIGSNLDGLQKFIHQSLEEKTKTLSLRLPSGQFDVQHALQQLHDTAREMRQPISQQQVADRVEAMLQRVCPEQAIDPKRLGESLQRYNVEPGLAKRMVELHDQWCLALSEYQALVSKIKSTGGTHVESTEAWFRNTYVLWFKRKIVVVPRFEATGEEIINTITDEVPPGFLAKVMGLQNIKGTGLDFVYRFQAWDTCHAACEAITGNDPQRAQQGLDTLLAMPEIGQLCQEFVCQSVEHARRSPALGESDSARKIDLLGEKLSAERAKTASLADGDGDHETGAMEQLKDWIYDHAEQYLDLNDSVKRRNKADLIYRELAHCRISRQRAIIELRKLNKRQKGGWLKATGTG